MSGTTWGLIALGGIGLVAISNAVRAKRTGDPSCLGHFFVSSDEMTTPEEVTNRTGIATFVVGIIAALLV